MSLHEDRPVTPVQEWRQKNKKQRVILHNIAGSRSAWATGRLSETKETLAQQLENLAPSLSQKKAVK